MGNIKIVISRAILMLLFILQSCLGTVPIEVEDAFMDKFSDAKDVVWAKSPNNLWIATYYMEKFHYMTAYFSPTGRFQAFEIEIHNGDIPKDLVNLILLKYPTANIFNVFERNTDRTTCYIFEIENIGHLFGVQIQTDGTYIIIPPNDYRFISRIHIEND